MNREVHVRFCEGLGCNSLGLLTYGHSVPVLFVRKPDTHRATSLSVTKPAGEPGQNP